MSSLPNDWRERVVAEARSWIGTPYHHAADIKKVGTDCAMILIRIYCDLGLAPQFDPRPYPAQWYLHRSEERYLAWIEKYAKRITKAEPGDLALYRFGRCAAHGAVVIDDDLMIHASQPARAVELVERRAFEDRFDSFWTPTGEFLSG